MCIHDGTAHWEKDFDQQRQETSPEKVTAQAANKTGIMLLHNDQLNKELEYLATQLDNREKQHPNTAKQAVKTVLATVDKITAISADLEKLKL